MQESILKNPPELHRYRQLHSRVFTILIVLLMLVSEPMDKGEILHTSMLGLGYILIIIGAFGRIYCSTYIGGYKNKIVVCDGPFGVVRNPLYIFSLIASIGISMQSGMLIMPIILICTFCWYYPKVVKKEEAFLTHTFGDIYTKYCQKVPRWVPNLKLWSEPLTTESQPPLLRHALKDAAVFFMPMPVFVIIWILHAHKMLPIWLILP